MPLLSNELSVWEIAHRWAGFDPAQFKPWLPLAVKDYCRILMDAILSGEIDSIMLRLDKWKPEDGEENQKFFIRYYMDDVYLCIWGKKFNRTMLKQASIDRYEMKQWCEFHTIPLPEFWFPPGWGYSYEWARRDDELERGNPISDLDDAAIRPSTVAKVTCQKIARGLWKDHPTMTIADMVKQPMIQQYGGAANYTDSTVREWLSAAAPSEVKNKRGRPRKKMPGDELMGGAAPEE
jgi:hypothetical protein